MNRNLSRRLAALCRWTARLLGTLLVLVIGTIAFGEGMPNPFAQPVPVQLGFLGLALVMGGNLAGWRWDVVPAVVSLMGWCLFVFATMQPRRLNSFIIALALPAVLLLASAILTPRSESQSPP